MPRGSNTEVIRFGYIQGRMFKLRVFLEGRHCASPANTQAWWGSQMVSISTSLPPKVYAAVPQQYLRAVHAESWRPFVMECLFHDLYKGELT